MAKDPILSSGFDEDAVQRLERFGFRFGDKGTHTSRTIMVEELKNLLRICPVQATRPEYTVEVIEHNCLAKHTASTRFLTNQRLGELYGLDAGIPLFRIMRRFWESADKGRSLLALLTALARDPLLRVTAPAVIRMRPGEELSRQQFTDALNETAADRLNPDSLDKVVRNTAASWTQSGHLVGRSRKTRQKVQPTPAVATFALLLGYVMGIRGQGLLNTLWTNVLDTSPDELTYLAMDAKRYGIMDIKQSGGILAVSFDAVLTDAERKLINGTH